MALDPATLKLIGKAAVAVATDEKTRRVVLIACLVPFIVLLLILSSPLAIFFALISGGSTQNDTVSIAETMNSLKTEFVLNIKSEQEGKSADEIKLIVMGSEDNTLIDNSTDVLSVFSTKYNGQDQGAQQIVVLNESQVDNLKKVYWDMNNIDTEYNTITETVTSIQVDADGNQINEEKTIAKTIKTVSVDCLTAEDMVSIYSFNERQQVILQELKKSGLGLMALNAVKLFLSHQEIQDIKSYIPEGVNVDGTKLVEIAKSIEGKVSYFWGGKSTAIGWDDRWGKNTEVTSLGSESTGTVRPFGLDCSGYVSWVFINMGLPIETIGHGTTAQWNASTAIFESDVKSGDLAFLAAPGTRKVNHIGIVVGKNDEGKIMVIHCSSGANNVTVSTAESVGFLYFRRPAVLI